MGTVYATTNRFALGHVRLFNGRPKYAERLLSMGSKRGVERNQSECRRDQKEARVMWRLAVPEMLGEKTLQCVVATSVLLLKDLSGYSSHCDLEDELQLILDAA